MPLKNIEKEIDIILEEEGFGSKLLNMIRQNAEGLSPNFITEILVENINLYIDYDILLEFLPRIWKLSNKSKSLLGYIAGITHHVLYLAKDYPLGKELPKYLEEKIEKTHKVLLKIDNKELKSPLNSLEGYGDINDFQKLINWLETFPRYPKKIKESVEVLAKMFKEYALKFPQKFRDEDEIAMFTSRCLIFWKMEVLTTDELRLCLEEMIKKTKENINIENIRRILPLEMLNYQFLQLGFTNEMIDKVAKVITNQYQLRHRSSHKLL